VARGRDAGCGGVGGADFDALTAGLGETARALMEPERAPRLVPWGVQAERPYIATSPGQKPIIAERCQAILAAHDDALAYDPNPAIEPSAAFLRISTDAPSTRIRAQSCSTETTRQNTRLRGERARTDRHLGRAHIQRSGYSVPRPLLGVSNRGPPGVASRRRV
jgi:hypothetical protein